MFKFKTGLLSLSADPVTFGHLDLIKRAAECSEHLTVVVAENPDKIPVFTSHERVMLMQRVLNDFLPTSNITVVASSGTMPDFVLEWDTEVVFRGIRNEQDRTYEMQQILLYSLAAPWADWTEKIHFLSADPELSQISSTVVREFARRHLEVTCLTPMYVQTRLWRKLHQQKVLGISGPDADQVGRNLERHLLAMRLPTTVVSLDTIDKHLIAEGSPGAKRLALGKTDDLRYAHRDRIYRKLLAEATGKVVLVTGEDLLAAGFIPRVNNNVVLLGSNPVCEEGIRRFQEHARYGTLFHMPEDVATLAQLIHKAVLESQI